MEEMSNEPINSSTLRFSLSRGYCLGLAGLPYLDFHTPSSHMLNSISKGAEPTQGQNPLSQPLGILIS